MQLAFAASIRRNHFHKTHSRTQRRGYCLAVFIFVASPFTAIRSPFSSCYFTSPFNLNDSEGFRLLCFYWLENPKPAEGKERGYASVRFSRPPAQP